MFPMLKHYWWCWFVGLLLQHAGTLISKASRQRISYCNTAKVLAWSSSFMSHVIFISIYMLIVELMRLDLSSFDSVKDFVKQFLSKGLPLHVLINNAGQFILFLLEYESGELICHAKVWTTTQTAVYSTPYAKTADGHERQFQINYLGRYISFLVSLSLSLFIYY